MAYWLTFALLAAFFSAGAVLIQKRTLINEHAMEFSTNLALLNVMLTLPFFFFVDFSQIKFWPLAFIFFASILGSIAFLLVAKGLRHMEISSASPLLVLGPGITATLAFIFLGESLKPLQVGGIGVLILGSYILELKDSHDFLHPIRVFNQSKYVYFIVIALILYGVSSVLDRQILAHFNVEPIAYIAFVHIFIAFHFIVMISIFHDGFKGIQNGFKNVGPWLLLASMLTIGYRFAQAQAVKIAYVGLVVPVKRLSAFFTTIIGGELYHEHNLLRKAIACLIMILGVILIVI